MPTGCPPRLRSWRRSAPHCDCPCPWRAALRRGPTTPPCPRGRRCPGAERQRCRHDRLLVMLDHHELQAVGERCLLERRKAHGGEGRRLGGRRGEGLGGHADRRTGGQEKPGHNGDHCPPVSQSGRPPSHCAPPAAAGFTTITTALAGSRYFAATRRTSAAVTARTRSKSLLISANDGWNMS